MPNLHIIFFQINSLTLLPEITTTGSASIDFVKYSTTTIKNLSCLTPLGNGPKIFIPQVLNDHGALIECNTSGGALL